MPVDPMSRCDTRTGSYALWHALNFPIGNIACTATVSDQ